MSSGEDGGDLFEIECLYLPEDFFSFNGGNLFETERLDPTEDFFGSPWFSSAFSFIPGKDTW